MTDLTVRVSAPGAREAATDINRTAQAADKLGDEAKETGQQVERMGSQVERAGGRASRMGRRVNRASVSVGRLNDRTKTAGGLVGALASGFSGLGAVSGETGGKIGALAGVVGAGGIFGIAAAGAAAIVGQLVENFQEAGEEAKRLQADLEKLFAERAKLVQQGLRDANVERQARAQGIDPARLDDVIRDFNLDRGQALQFEVARRAANEQGTGEAFIQAAFAARRGGLDVLAAGTAASEAAFAGPGSGTFGAANIGTPAEQAIAAQLGGDRAAARRLLQGSNFATGSQQAEAAVRESEIRAAQAVRGGVDPALIRAIKENTKTSAQLLDEYQKAQGRVREANARTWSDKALKGAQYDRAE